MKKLSQQTKVNFVAIAPEVSSMTCLTHMLVEQAKLQPNCIAVVFEDQSMSFADLVRMSSQLSAYLCHLGVKADDCIGLFVEPSLELMVGAWGILFSGGAYLPLSPEYPEDRLRYMIDDSRTKIIFSQKSLAKRLRDLAPPGVNIVTLDDEKQFSLLQSNALNSQTKRGPSSDSLAYIIYTSGSTGHPKGVMIEHQSVVNQMRWLRNECGLSAGLVVLQKTPMSFDAAQWEILAPTCGARVVMGPSGVYKDPLRLIETMAKHKVTTLQCVPTLLQALLDTECFQACTSLNQVFSGGEALSRNLALQFIETLPGSRLTNLYGPTECTINSSAATVTRASIESSPGTISIGAPVYNTSYYVLDSQLKVLGIGEAGELFISGVQLARGYLHKPEMTAERFIPNPFGTDFGHSRLYKTGDLVSRNKDGTVQFHGRADNQVKLRGFRVELDEIRISIEAHDWVKHAAVVVKNDPRTGFQNLVSFVELNPKEAALMDQGVHGSHHQSKLSKVQVRAQLSGLGVCSAEQLADKLAVELPGKEPTSEQRQLVFARKTYRFYNGGPVRKVDLLQLLGRRISGCAARSVESLEFRDLSAILRYFGEFRSDRRLLPKYGYASPGALYATQIYIEFSGRSDLCDGIYYYHPTLHQLFLVSETTSPGSRGIKLHFLGKRMAIEPVYKNNIQEVLEMEAGHIIGLFEEILPRYGIDVVPLGFFPDFKARAGLDAEDYYLGTFELTPFELTPFGSQKDEDALDMYVQVHPGKVADLEAGQYRYRAGDLEKISDELVQKKHVIAINQQVYARASFGITVVSRGERSRWSSYVDLGRKLQSLQLNNCGMGFMSSGYSSKTGNPLLSSVRIESILAACGLETGPSYFFVGGPVSTEQVQSDGMNEDVVHMMGPAEMIKSDLVNFLPHYMVPNRVVILNKLPLTANGKIDVKALHEIDVECSGRPVVTPRSDTERRIAEVWKSLMKHDNISVLDDFFESGGNSLLAVMLVSKINKEFCSSLPLQIVFNAPTVEKLALALDGECSPGSSRLILLQAKGTQKPVYCWPGLGGYIMNLRMLANKIDIGRPVYGVQACGINLDETPYATIQEMAAEDVRQIKLVQPEGPYTLWGYSFGARVAFEAAYQMEQAGEAVESVYLIAPGSPKLRARSADANGREASFANKAYVTILYSVFAGTISGSMLDECLEVVKDEATFAKFIQSNFPNLDLELVCRIMRIVAMTYQFEYSFGELLNRQIQAPITIFKARGDDYSFIESQGGYSARAPTIVELEADHYELLRQAGIDELVTSIRALNPKKLKEDPMPHVNIRHFPKSFTKAQEEALVAEISGAVSRCFQCELDVISIALEPVEPNDWKARVYDPEIIGRSELLCKTVNY